MGHHITYCDAHARRPEYHYVGRGVYEHGNVNAYIFKFLFIICFLGCRFSPLTGQVWHQICHTLLICKKKATKSDEYLYANSFLSCRKHSRQWSYVQLFARWEQMILEMKMIVMDHDVNVTQLGVWQFCLICGTKCPLTVLFTSLVGWETQIKMVILKCFRNSTL